MGEIADAMLNGEMCSLCGVYFVDSKNKEEIYEHGYPVVCTSCWHDLTKEERKQYQKQDYDCETL